LRILDIAYRFPKDHKTLKTGVMAAENSALPKRNVTFEELFSKTL